MRSLRKRVRALRSSKLFAEVLALRGSVKIIEDSKTHRAEDLKGNIKRFFEEVFGFTPFKYQEKLAEIFEKNQFIWVRWCRQSGKSFSVAALFCRIPAKTLRHSKENLVTTRIPSSAYS